MKVNVCNNGDLNAKRLGKNIEKGIVRNKKTVFENVTGKYHTLKCTFVILFMFSYLPQIQMY